MSRTVAAARRLVTTHVDLARAELSEIAERAKVAAALIGAAVAIALFAAILASVGTALFIGEWLFGSIGWGVLHGVLSCVALVVVLVLAALEIPRSRITTSLVAALGLGIVVAVVLGLAWPNQAFARVGDALIPGVDPNVRTLVAGLAVGAVVLGIVGFLVGARAGGAGGAIGGLIGGAVVGVLVGAFLAISFSLRVGIALGIATALIAWPALAATGSPALRPGSPQGSLLARHDHRDDEGDHRVGARTDAARQEAVAARAGLVDEVERLKSSARSAVDVKAKVKRYPARAAGAVAGTAFLAAGGPRRIFRAVKRKVVGEPEPLPASLLPDQVERAVRALGDDGGKVRGALERGFADYLMRPRATARLRRAVGRSRGSRCGSPRRSRRRPPRRR